MQLHEQILEIIIEHDKSGNPALITAKSIMEKLSHTDESTFFENMNYLSSKNLIKIHAYMQSGVYKTSYQLTPLGKAYKISKIQEKRKKKEDFIEKIFVSLASQIVQKVFAFVLGYLLSIATYDKLKAHTISLLEKIIYWLSNS